MAFNPLHSLRKRQKVLMAALVFVCMVTFILSSGTMMGGDFFDWLRNVLAGRGGSQEVATLYGEQIDRETFERVRTQRQLASEYMKQAVDAARNQIQNDIQTLREQAKKGPDPTVLSKEGELQGMLQTLGQRPGRFTPMLYFGGSDKADDILDFLIWKKQADRLGIQLTEADVARERDRETVRPLPDTVRAQIERNLAGTGRREGPTKTQLVNALADEFRVRLAKAALLGPDVPPQHQQFGSHARVQTTYTAHEYWEFFDKSRTQISVLLLPIPAQELLPTVTATPSDEELRELFEKYKEREPNPEEPTPGFKQPRRIHVEWVSVNPKEAPYPQAIDASLAVLEATMPAVFWDQLLTVYSREKRRFHLPDWVQEQKGEALLPALKQPDFETVARLHGLPTTGLTEALLTAAAGAYQAREIALDRKDLGNWVEEETKKRKQFLASSLALTGVPAPPETMLGAALLGVAARQHEGDRAGPTLPVQAVKRYLIKNVHDKIASDQVRFTNLEAFRKELESRRSRPDEVKKYVAEAVAKYGFKTGGTHQPRDQHTLFEDPGMKPLLEPLKAPNQSIMQMLRREDDPKGRFLGHVVFNGLGAFIEPLLKRTYTPQTAPSRDGTTYVYWSTSDKAPYVPRFEEVKGQVADAWRFTKAREAAKQEAERVAEKARQAELKGRELAKKQPTANDEPLPSARDELLEGSPYSGKVIDLFDVTRLKEPERSALADPNREYTPYHISGDLIEFPTRDFIDKLLSLNDVGDVIVLHDQPETTYYVVTARTPKLRPVRDEFLAIYRRSLPAGSLTDPLMGLFDRERREQQQKAVMNQLRAEAKLKKNDEVIKQMQER